MYVMRLLVLPFSFPTKQMKKKKKMLQSGVDPSLQEPSTATRDGSAEGGGVQILGAGSI